MINYFNLIFGIILMPIGLMVAFPNIKDKLDGKSSKFRYIGGSIFGGIVVFVSGLLFILRELFG